MNTDVGDGNGKLLIKLELALYFYSFFVIDYWCSDGPWDLLFPLQSGEKI